MTSLCRRRNPVWSLDIDYDERSLFPHQVFFQLAGRGEAWEKLKKDIRAELDEDAIDADEMHAQIEAEFGLK
jgi:hypothetical protein